MQAGGAVADLRARLARTAGNPELHPSERVRELRRARGEAEELAAADPEATNLIGQADSYIGSNELQRDAGAIRRTLQLAQARESATVREQMLARGQATVEDLDAAGLLSHEALDELASEGTLGETLEEAAATGELRGLHRGVLHPRERWPGRPGRIEATE